MSVIIEAIVVTSILSAIASVVTAVVAKRRTNLWRRKMEHLHRMEKELQEAFLEAGDLDTVSSENVRKSIEDLEAHIKETERVVHEEHNRQMQSTRKARG